MKKKRKSSASVQKTSDGFIGRLFAQTQLPAHVTEEQDWYLDTPDVRLTRVFTIVLILHVVAVGGILAFKMVEKASTPETLAAITGTEETTTETEAAATAAAAPQSETTDTETAAAVKADAVEKPAGESALLVDHPSAVEYQEYRVGSGDSLISIARELGVSASKIREINNLDSGGNLAVGRWIRVPKTEKTASNAGSSVAAVAPAKPKPAPKPEPTVEKPAPQKPAVAAAPATSQPEPAAPASANRDRYKVQKGDTLFGIARQFGIKYQDLMAANGIQKPEHLQAGQTLRVPGN